MYVCISMYAYSVSDAAFKSGQRKSSCSVLGCVTPESPSVTNT